MTTEQTRLAIVVLLAVTIAFGLYLGWHFTHVHHTATPPVACGGGWGQPACH